MEIPWTPLSVPDRWCVHAYYSLCPYAPDGSGRILVAGADLEAGRGEVLVLSGDGQVLDRFGSVPLQTAFYHTGLWQTWSPDAQAVYYQSGSLSEPAITRRCLRTGTERTMRGDMEGAPPHGEPIVSGLMGMLYAAGYGGGGYRPDQAPAPFADRSAHGLFEYSLESGTSELQCSVAGILDRHPRRDWLRSVDRDVAARLGADEGATLMAYCVRWNRDGSRCLFYFGNHCVDGSRGEPRIAFIMTTNRAMDEFHVALDLCGKPGDHWSWQPDGETLIGNGPDPESGQVCLAEVRFDGSEYRKLVDRPGGGHPSVSPKDPDLIVTDCSLDGGGAIQFYSRRSRRELARLPLPKFSPSGQLPGRNPSWVCHHPVFDRTGDRVLCNHLPGPHAAVGEILLPF